jgi:hypothetical protein
MADRIKTTKTDTGYVASDSGTWLPGVFDSEQTARLAATLDAVALAAIWKEKLAHDHDPRLTMEDVANA